MEEPTVLDLFKSIFKDWRSFWNFLRSLFDAAQREQLSRRLEEERQAQERLASTEIAGHEIEEHSTGFAWRSVLALGFGLSAQFLLEPPGRSVLAIGFYLLALVFLIWGIARDEWQLQPLKTESAQQDFLVIRILPLALAFLAAVPAFILFGRNQFTWLNLVLWLLSIVLFMIGLWLPGRGTGWKFPGREAWPGLLAGLFVAAVVIFFRVYQIAQIPVEPFSDHAEKIMDVYDVTQGQTRIFFPRNTGREAIQIYWTLLVSWWFGTGLSFLSLKLGTVLLGLLTLPYIYLLGKELGGIRVGLLATFLMGIAYWPNVISRIGLRFPLYPLFVAPTLFYVLRGFRRQNRNDFILAGLFLGLGLHGYSPFRIVPLLVLVAFLLYWLHMRSMQKRSQAVTWLIFLIFVSLLLFLPLLSYSLENPNQFAYRAFSRLGTIETDYQGPWWQILLSNVVKGLLMLNVDNGGIWVNSVPGRPALGVVSGVFFLMGVVLLLARYLRHRDWRDLFLLLAVPVLQLPSTLSLAYPGENPALNRASGVTVVVFVIVALALDGLVAGLERWRKLSAGKVLAWSLVGLLLFYASVQNYQLVFDKFARQFRLGAWNSSEMGAVINSFEQENGTTDTVWIVPYPHWVDTRLPGVWAGIPDRDFAVWQYNLESTLAEPGEKMFLVKANLENPEFNDQTSLDILQELYPNGELRLYDSSVPGHDFWIFTVPAE
ncbi:MAG: glycosyltransferase family 39 protein [Anaerolineales bacterium]|nr:glycosyltransferase family 39 protein [Anaerolineales bacterium]